ncbi:MAG TPA: hypothetical protein VIM33_08900 [Gaiellaceae bacterium]
MTLEARGELGSSLPPSSLVEQQRLTLERVRVRQMMDARGAPMLLALELEMRGRWRDRPPNGPPKDLGHDLLLEQLTLLRFYPDMPWAYLVWERDQGRGATDQREREAIRQLHDFVDNWLRLPRPEPGFYDWTPFMDMEMFEEDRLAQEEQETQKDGRYYASITKDGPRVDFCLMCARLRPLRAGRNVCEKCRRDGRSKVKARPRIRAVGRPTGETSFRGTTTSEEVSEHVGTFITTGWESKGQRSRWEAHSEQALREIEQKQPPDELDELERQMNREDRAPSRRSSTGHQTWIRMCLRVAAAEAGYSFEDFTAPLPEGRPSATEAKRRNALARAVYELNEQGVTLKSIRIALGFDKKQIQRLKNRANKPS